MSKNKSKKIQLYLKGEHIITSDAPFQDDYEINFISDFSEVIAKILPELEKIYDNYDIEKDRNRREVNDTLTFLDILKDYVKK